MYTAAISCCHCFHSISKTLLGQTKIVSRYCILILKFKEKVKEDNSRTNITFYTVSTSQVSKYSSSFPQVQPLQLPDINNNLRSYGMFPLIMPIFNSQASLLLLAHLHFLGLSRCLPN